MEVDTIYSNESKHKHHKASLRIENLEVQRIPSVENYNIRPEEEANTIIQDRGRCNSE